MSPGASSVLSRETTGAIVISEDRNRGPDVLVGRKTSWSKNRCWGVLLRQTAVGINFHDCYARSGLSSPMM